MKRLFISDLHIGSPLFKNKNKVLELLNDNTFDEIYLIGDILDIWEANLKTIVRNNQDIINSINKTKVYYIIGNHDPKIDKLKSILPNVQTQNRKSLLSGVLIHGHQYDKNIGNWSIGSIIAFYMYWILERILGFDIRPYFRKTWISLSSNRNKDYYEDLVLKVEEEAYDEFKPYYKFLIMGHTHLPKIHKNKDDFLYINCGDWINNNTYVTLENNCFTLYNINDKIIDQDFVQ